MNRLNPTNKTEAAASSQNPGTVEGNIARAACEVFVEKGYEGATMREIASRAGINISMLHYYYRSKDNLFDLVFDHVFRRMYGRIIDAMAAPGSVADKIRTMVGLYLDTLAEDPRLPNFIFNEVTQRPERSGRFASYKDFILVHLDAFQAQLDRAAARGEIRPVSAMELIIAIESLCVYPFLTQPLWQKLFAMPPQDFGRLIASQRDTFIHNLLKSIEKK